nr:MAG TPA: hypothetical protein [Caudoviricetes sp.]
MPGQRPGNRSGAGEKFSFNHSTFKYREGTEWR